MALPKLTEDEVKHIIDEFFRMNAGRSRIVDFIKIMDENCEIRLVGKDGAKDIVFQGYQGLEDHQEGKRIFFDQEFKIFTMKIDISDKEAVVKTTGQWDARYWQSPEAKSRLLKVALEHTWIIIRSEKTQKPVILKQICESYHYLPGFAPHDYETDFHLTQE